MAATKAAAGRTRTAAVKPVRPQSSSTASERPGAPADDVPVGLRGTWIAPDALIAFSIPIPETTRSWPQLSPAEQACVALALQGLSTAAIAEQRAVTARTVARQLDSAYHKLGVQSRGELAALAVSDKPAPRTRR